MQEEQIQSTLPKAEVEGQKPVQKIKIVIDTNAILKRLSLKDLLQCKDQQEFDEAYEVHTLQDVVKEIRDEQARLYFQQSLPYQVKVHESTDPSHLIMVSNFAKDTGDFKTLSQTDMKVISLGITLASQTGEFSKIKNQPKPLTEFKPKQFFQDYQRLEKEIIDSEDSEEEIAKPEEEEDGFTQVKQGKRNGKNIKLAKKTFLSEESKSAQQVSKVEGEEQPSTTEQQPLVQVQQVVEEESSSDIDDEAEGGEWITPDNLFKHIGGGESVIVKQQKEDKDVQLVQFITSDYAMQNVIIQMGFKLLSLDGRKITRVKRFKLLCRACQKLNLKIDKQFCEFCGSHTLVKVSVYINENGDITYFKNPRRKTNLRGKIFSIPKPKGGRGNKDLILREDELLTGEKRILTHDIAREQLKTVTLINDTLKGNYWQGGEGYSHQVSNLLYENGAKGGKTGSKKSGQTDHIVIGYGKKNPNIVKKSTGNR